MKILHSKVLGNGQPFLILHGFLGMSDNWKTLGNRFSKNFQVHLIDQRNHGRSFHSEDFSYELMSSDLENYINYHQLKNCIILGHSMGGKTAMQFTLNNPSLVAKLIIADIAPKVYPAHHQYILKALDVVNFSEIKSRKNIETVLKQYIKELGVIQFLLKNVYRTDKGYAYRFNLPVLKQKYNEVVKTFKTNKQFNKPVLFLKGENSAYIEDSDLMLMQKNFKLAEIQGIKNAGHWLHAEQSDKFYEKVMLFC